MMDGFRVAEWDVCKGYSSNEDGFDVRLQETVPAKYEVKVMMSSLGCSSFTPDLMIVSDYEWLRLRVVSLSSDGALASSATVLTQGSRPQEFWGQTLCKYRRGFYVCISIVCSSELEYYHASLLYWKWQCLGKTKGHFRFSLKTPKRAKIYADFRVATSIRPS